MKLRQKHNKTPKFAPPLGLALGDMVYFPWFRWSSFARYFTTPVLLLCAPFGVSDDSEYSSGDGPVALKAKIDQTSLSIRLQTKSDGVCVEFPNLGSSIFFLKYLNGEFVLWESPIKGFGNPRYVTLYEGEALEFSESTKYLGNRYELAPGETFRVMYSPSPYEQNCTTNKLFVDVVFP